MRDLYDQMHKIEEKIEEISKTIDRMKITDRDLKHLCGQLYDNQEKVNAYINNIYEKKYNEMWLNSPDEIREKESERNKNEENYKFYYDFFPNLKPNDRIIATSVVNELEKDKIEKKNEKK